MIFRGGPDPLSPPSGSAHVYAQTPLLKAYVEVSGVAKYLNIWCALFSLLLLSFCKREAEALARLGKDISVSYCMVCAYVQEDNP